MKNMQGNFFLLIREIFISSMKGYHGLVGLHIDITGYSSQVVDKSAEKKSYKFIVSVYIVWCINNISSQILYWIFYLWNGHLRV